MSGGAQSAGEQAGDETEDLAHLMSRGFEPVQRREWFMVGLAVADVFLLVARDAYGALAPETVRQAVYVVDLAVVLVFGAEFVVRAMRASNFILYARSHWYDVVGLVPIAHPALRAFRLVRLLRMYTVATFPLEADRTHLWEWALLRGLIRKYRAILVEEITDPIVLASLDVVEGPLVRARFAASVGASLTERRSHVHTIVEDAVRNTRGASHVLRLEWGRKLVENITDAILDASIHALRSDELNEVISDTVEGILAEIREKVNEKDYRAAP